MQSQQGSVLVVGDRVFADKKGWGRKYEYEIEEIKANGDCWLMAANAAAREDGAAQAPLAKLRLLSRAGNDSASSKQRGGSGGSGGGGGDDAEPQSQMTVVSWNPDTRQWSARITRDGKRRHLGYFDSNTKAAEACTRAAAAFEGKDPEPAEEYGDDDEKDDDEDTNGGDGDSGNGGGGGGGGGERAA